MLPHPDHMKTCEEYNTLFGTSSLIGLFLAPEISFAEEIPSTIISQSGCIFCRRHPASSAAVAQRSQLNVPQNPCTSFRRSAPTTRGFSTNGVMIFSQFNIHWSLVNFTLHNEPRWSFFH